MKMTREEMRALPLLDAPITARLKFIKTGKLQYISHLDLQRTMMRVIARSGIPVWFTQGFNPHAKLVFAAPIAVGVQSVCELLDIRLDRKMKISDLIDTLNAHLTTELCVIDAYYPTTKFADIVYADYSVEICTAGASLDLARTINERLLSGELKATKKSKSGEKEIDVKSVINSISISFDEVSRNIKMAIRLPAGNVESISPEVLIGVLREQVGILSGDPTKEWYTIMRTKLLCGDGKEFK